MFPRRHFVASLVTGALLASGVSTVGPNQATQAFATVASGSDFAATYVSAPSTLQPGNSGDYVVEGRNNGPDYGYYQIDITATGPVAEITTDDTVNCTNSTGSISCQDAISPGQSTPQEFTITASGPGAITTTATITPIYGSVDPDSSNNTATTTTTVPEDPADIAVALTATPGPLLASRIDYSLTAANQGPGNVANATIDVQLPTQTDSVPGLPPGCTFTAGTDTVRCATGAIANGATSSKSFRANLGLLAIGALSASAHLVTSNPADPNGANNAASADCTVLTSLIVTCN